MWLVLILPVFTQFSQQSPFGSPSNPGGGEQNDPDAGVPLSSDLGMLFLLSGGLVLFIKKRKK